MKTAYEIASSADEALLVITFADVFWDYEIKTQFVADTVQAIMNLGCEFGRQRIIVDLRNAILQSQATIKSLQKFLSDPMGGSVALIAETPLARMQTKRLQVREGVRMFPTYEAAEVWLNERAPVLAAAS